MSEERTEPTIDLKAAQRHMPQGFPIIDPDSMMARAQLAGLEIHGLASAHLAASNRALWRRVADLEVDLNHAHEALGERDLLRARVAELEAYQRNAGIWMAELIEKIDRYEGALRRVSVPVGESTLDARIAIATNALTA